MVGLALEEWLSIREFPTRPWARLLAAITKEDVRDAPEPLVLFAAKLDLHSSSSILRQHCTK